MSLHPQPVLFTECDRASFTPVHNNRHPNALTVMDSMWIFVRLEVVKALSVKVTLLARDAVQLSLQSDRLQYGRPSNRSSIPGLSTMFISSPKLLDQLDFNQQPSRWLTRVSSTAVKRSRCEAGH